jgi:hypothetical protein
MLGIAAPRMRSSSGIARRCARPKPPAIRARRNWRGSLLHNLGWTLHERGDYEGALATGSARSPLARRGRRAAHAHREVDGCARLRSLGASTRPSASSARSPPRRGAQPPDGYYYEELAEIAWRAGRGRARPWAAKAMRSSAGHLAHRQRAGALGAPRADRRSRAVNPAKRRAIFERAARGQSRSRRPSSSTRRPYELLVSVVLSAQATDKSVNKATAELYKVANTPRQMARLGVDGLIRTSAPSASITTRRRT